MRVQRKGKARISIWLTFLTHSSWWEHSLGHLPTLSKQSISQSCALGVNTSETWVRKRAICTHNFRPPSAYPVSRAWLSQLPAPVLITRRGPPACLSLSPPDCSGFRCPCSELRGSTTLHRYPFQQSLETQPPKQSGRAQRGLTVSSQTAWHYSFALRRSARNANGISSPPDLSD